MTAQPERHPSDQRILVLLHNRVTLARTEVQLGRTLPPSPHRMQDQNRRCHRLMDALQDYADATFDAGVPLPYRYRDELRLYRSMYAGVARS